MPLREQAHSYRFCADHTIPEHRKTIVGAGLLAKTPAQSAKNPSLPPVQKPPSHGRFQPPTGKPLISGRYHPHIGATSARAFAYKSCGSGWLVGFPKQFYLSPRIAVDQSAPIPPKAVSRPKHSGCAKPLGVSLSERHPAQSDKTKNGGERI